MLEEKKDISLKRKVLRFFASQIGGILIICMLYLIVLGIFLIMVELTGAAAGIAFVVLAYFGWRALSKIQPQMFIIMPVGGWLIYILVKGLLSIMIGIFVAPFVIARKINGKLRDMAREMAEREEASHEG